MTKTTLHNLRESALRVMRDSEPMTKKQIIDAASIHPHRWKPLQKHLREEGYITNVGGLKSGARWVATDKFTALSERPIVARLNAQGANAIDTFGAIESSLQEQEQDLILDRSVSRLSEIRPPRQRNIQPLKVQTDTSDIREAQIDLTPFMRLREAMPDADTIVVNWSTGTDIFTVEWVAKGTFTVKVESL